MASTRTRRPYGVRNVATWDMTPVELARTWADHFGYTGRAGGWIYDPEGQPVVQGWDSFAEALTSARFIIPGTGIEWRRSGERPRVPIYR